MSLLGNTKSTKCEECGYEHDPKYFFGGCMFCMRELCNHCFRENGHYMAEGCKEKRDLKLKEMENNKQ